MKIIYAINLLTNLLHTCLLHITLTCEFHNICTIVFYTMPVFLIIAGVQSARNSKVIQPSDASKQRVLPKFDFPNRLVNATPEVNR